MLKFIALVIYYLLFETKWLETFGALRMEDCNKYYNY